MDQDKETRRSPYLGYQENQLKDLHLWMTTQEAAEYSGYDLEHVRRLARQGKIGAVKKGRDWRVDVEKFNAYLNVTMRSALSAPERRIGKNVKAMKTQDDDQVQTVGELRAHYEFDYCKAKPNRFAGRFGEEAVAIVLDPDVAAVFTTSEAANEALRVLIDALGNLAETPDLLEKVKGSSASAAFSPS